MKYRTITPELRVPMLAYGTWRLGGIRHPDTSQDSQHIEILQKAIEMGYTHIDTAEMYGGGHTEKLVGISIQDFQRQQLQICTKVWHTNLRYHDVLRAFEDSLKRLKTDYIDFYAIHLPSAHIPLAETFRALNELVDQDLVRNLAVSNFTVDQLKLAEKYAKTPIVIAQAPCSLYNRKFIIGGLVSYCQESGKLMGSYSPFEHGTLFDHPALHEIAGKHGASPAQVALAWILEHASTMVYLTSSNEKHLRDNLQALDLKLTPKDMEKLDGLDMPEERLWPE